MSKNVSEPRNAIAAAVTIDGNAFCVDTDAEGNYWLMSRQAHESGWDEMLIGDADAMDALFTVIKKVVTP